MCDINLKSHTFHEVLLLFTKSDSNTQYIKNNATALWLMHVCV